MSIFKATKSVLGMNARNLHYVSKFNSAADKRFADNKLFTKQYLGSRDIGVAKLYHTIKSYSQLTDSFFDSLPKEFVLKPNKGFAGAGIAVISGRDKLGNFVTISGKKFSREHMYNLCIEIIDGKYSISGVGDSALFEELLRPHEAFRQLTQVGLPDVRVIVFNGVPVLAMLRVPTYESDGKANMELGAIALGIDMGNGSTTGGAYYSQYITKMPNGVSARGFQVPFWDKILHTCSKIQLVTGIGFLGVDIVITPDGVRVLELNARSGLKIQIANKAGLRGRLNKIGDLTVRTPEEGVNISKTLFGIKQQKEELKLDRPVVGLLEAAVLNGTPPRNVKVKLSMESDTSVMGIKGFEGNIADLTLAGKRIKLPVETGEVVGADICLSAKQLGQFYIDPTKKYAPPVAHAVTATSTDQLKKWDDKLAQVAEQLKLLSAINPTNISEQKELFLSHPEFEPRFTYRPHTADTRGLLRDLSKLPVVDHPLYSIFDARRKELTAQLELVNAVNTNAYAGAAVEAFGGISAKIEKAAWKAAREGLQSPPDESPTLNLKQAEERIMAYLKSHKLGHWQMKRKADSAVDMQVTKQNVLLMREGATFQENRLEALLVHEIGTHVFRLENGRKQPWRIFERGTANYLRTEEGLAIWNQNRIGLPLGAEKTASPALHVLTIKKAMECGFLECWKWLTDEMKLSPNRAWHHCLKAKRGMEDTGQPGALTKDAVYFIGLQEVEQYLQKGGDIQSLYGGKITTDIVPILTQMDGYVPAKWIPLAQ